MYGMHVPGPQLTSCIRHSDGGPVTFKTPGWDDMQPCLFLFGTQVTRFFYFYNEPLPLVSAVQLIACYTRKNADCTLLKPSKTIQ